MLDIDRIYNEECLEGMAKIDDASVDCIICDLPYGTMKGANLKGWDDNTVGWDSIIPTDKLFNQYERILRRNGVAILFSMEPYTSHLRQFKSYNMEFCYPLYWKKNVFANCLLANVAPVSYVEDLSVFRKKHDSALCHPLRSYVKSIMQYIGVNSCKAVNDKLGHRKAEHFFYVDSSQFALCTQEVYNELISFFHIDDMPNFIPFDNLQELDKEYKRKYAPTFNLQEGSAYMSNLLDFKKDTDGFHPTQKPLDLLRYLVLTYSNEGDTILDNTCGSGTTCVAAFKEKRHFIGFELNKEYYDKAQQRIKRERQQLSLF